MKIRSPIALTDSDRERLDRIKAKLPTISWPKSDRQKLLEELKAQNAEILERIKARKR